VGAFTDGMWVTLENPQDGETSPGANYTVMWNGSDQSAFFNDLLSNEFEVFAK